MPGPNSSDQRCSGDPEGTYLTMRGDLREVLRLPLEGQRELFRDFLVGYLIVEHGYSEARAMSLVAGNEDAILLMLTEEQEGGLY
jgi:hypothetical protein